jgi:predicted ABC-type sugar transport system permease subunit
MPQADDDAVYAASMVAVDWATEIVPLFVLVCVAFVVAVWLVLTRVFKRTRAGRHAAHFLDVGGADMSPEDRVKYTNQHPGAGGNG